VGGTKTVLGLFSPGRRRPRLRIQETTASSASKRLEDIIEPFLKAHSPSVGAACFGVAGPVANGICRTTNLPWQISEGRIRKRFGFPQVRLVNDLMATAFAVPLLRPKELYSLNRRRAAGPVVGLVAPGTGLGMALIVESETGPICLPSEGGHMDFAPTDTLQQDLWTHLHRRFGHVSVERVVSGPGLVNIYSWLKETGVQKEPAWLARRLEAEDPARAISEAAMARTAPLATEALHMFISVLGAVTGNLALAGLTTGGIYLGGGICPRILPELKGGGLLTPLAEKGRFKDLLSKIPVKVIRNPRAALLGAAFLGAQALRHAAEEKGAF
jgi:glucokinase